MIATAYLQLYTSFTSIFVLNAIASKLSVIGPSSIRIPRNQDNLMLQKHDKGKLWPYE